MNRLLKISAILLTVVLIYSPVFSQDTFSDIETKKMFAKDITSMIEGAWKRWQGGVVINGVEVEGARGILQPGDLQGVYFTADNMLNFFNKKDKSRKYVESIKAVAHSLEHGMRAWQKGYSHSNIPFPQGASCVFTLTPCNNVPVTLVSGKSLGRQEMTERDLYGYMLYLLPKGDKTTMAAFKISARAISDGFSNWARICSIVNIEASGGIAPQPSPMGSGPGPVRGAQGNNGRLAGPYFDADEMYRAMVVAIEGEN